MKLLSSACPIDIDRNHYYHYYCYGMGWAGIDAYFMGLGVVCGPCRGLHYHYYY